MRNETTKSHFLRYRNSNPAFIGPRKFSVNTCMAATIAKLAIYIQIRLKKRIINTKTMEKRLKLIVHHPCKSDLETVFPRIKHRVWHGQLPFVRKNASYVKVYPHWLPASSPNPFRLKNASKDSTFIVKFEYAFADLTKVQKDHTCP